MKLAGILIMTVSYVLTSYIWVQSIATDLALEKQQSRIFEDATNRQLKALSDGLDDNRKAESDLNITLTRTNDILENIQKRDGNGH